MSLKKDYRDNHTGPGGIGCPCCNQYNCHPRNMKALTRRKKRRHEKMGTNVRGQRIQLADFEDWAYNHS